MPFMQRKAIFIAATGQHVGKTTLCLGMIAALKKFFPLVGFMKPVGQQHEVVAHGLRVDKDVVLFKEYFQLPASYEEMSPVIFPSGFTRDYLDGKISLTPLKQKISTSFENILSQNDFTIVEGTGHVGVGSIVNLSNADVASLLGLDIVLIAKGGIGSTYDELALNKVLCDHQGIKIRGVILNRVYPDKRETVIHYMSKALKRWNIPLIGCLPFDPLLNTPSMEDFEKLFNTTLFSGEEHHHLHFESIRLVASSMETFRELSLPNQLIVTPAAREDIILSLLEKHTSQISPIPDCGLILTGFHPPSNTIIEKLKKANIPALYVAKTNFDVLRLMTSFTAKIRKEDTSKVLHAIQLVETHVDFSLMNKLL